MLYRKIQNILLKEWDPIGIQEIPEAQDEYDSYIGSIYNLINSRKSASEIFEYLWNIEIKYMGLCGNKKHTEASAMKFAKLLDAL